MVYLNKVTYGILDDVPLVTPAAALITDSENECMHSLDSDDSW